MKHVIFKRLSIQNFLSIGREPVTLYFDHKLNIITGVNKDMEMRRNAIGKTTITDALYFAIFGTTLRELKKEFIINNITNLTCEVELDFDVIDTKKTSYRIVRRLNPSKCFLYKDQIDITRDSIANTTQFIHDLIEASPSVFKNCVVMSLNNTIPFMLQDKVEKRKFIESIFNLQVFTKMLLHVREEYNENKKLYEIDLAKITNDQLSLKSLIDERNNIINSRKTKLIELQNRKQKIIDEIKREKEKAEKIQILDDKELQKNIKILSDGLDQIRDKIANLQQDIAINNTRVNSITVQLSDITTGSVCESCLRKLDKHDHENLDKIKKDKQQERDCIVDEIKKLQLQLSKSNKKNDDIKNLIAKTNSTIKQNIIRKSDKKTILNNITNKEEWLKSFNDEIKNNDQSDTSLDSSIEKYNKSIKELEIIINKHVSHLDMLDKMKNILSEEGVKAYITRKILSILNSKIQFYLDKIGFKCTCRFNEFFQEEIINNSGKLCSYSNFSGAERKSIDLACLFAFIDIRKMQGNVSYNIIFYDELLDSSLDDRGVELAFNIIKDRTLQFNECAYIITHRKDADIFSSCNVIFLEKHKGITHRVA